MISLVIRQCSGSIRAQEHLVERFKVAGSATHSTILKLWGLRSLEYLSLPPRSLRIGTKRRTFSMSSGQIPTRHLLFIMVLSAQMINLSLIVLRRFSTKMET